jgi:5-methylthioadenosine/S-adenosylhomocysteine deaminase
MPAVNVVEIATRGGARALHLEDRVGSLEAGKLADVVILDTEATHLIPLYDVYAALVYAAGPRDVRTTIVHGRVLMEDRRLLTVDVAEVRSRLRAITARINTIAEWILGFHRWRTRPAYRGVRRTNLSRRDLCGT